MKQNGDHEVDGSSSMVDITAVIEAAASSLSVTDPFLCNEESFCLHDSMAALELTDRKLDCCEIPISVYDKSGKHDENRFIPPRPKPSDLDELPWDDLTLEDAKHVALQILTRLESMLSGASVSESTFTCLYAHEPVMKDIYVRLQQPLANQITEKMAALLMSSTSSAAVGTPAQRAVYACVLGLVAISHMIHHIAFNADIYEEEDFSINTHGLMDYYGEDGDLAETEDVLQRTLQQLQGESGDDVPIITLVLGFQLAFFRVCTTLAKLSAETVRQSALEAKGLVRAGVQTLRRLESMLPDEEDANEGKNKVVEKAFDLYVNRPLVGNAPIRKVVFRKPLEAISTLSTIFSEVDWAVCDLLLKGTSLARIRRMLNRVSNSSVNILSRSLIVLNLYFDDRLLGHHLLRPLVAKDMQQQGGIPSVLTDGEFGRMFLGRLAKPTYDVLKLLVLNRNRQCSYMEAVVLKEWSVLQQEANAVDLNNRREHPDGLLGETPLPPYFTQYILLTTVWLMEHYVALGVELGLFCGQHELSVAFWYRDFLLSTLLNTMTSARRAKMAAKLSELPPAEAPTAAPKTKGKKKGAQKKKAQSPAKAPLITLEDTEDEMEVLMLGTKRNMCRGIVRFIAALNQSEVLCLEPFEFTSHERMFKKRFEAFSAVPQPPPLTHDDYRQGTDFAAVTQGDLMASITECFKASKSDIDVLTKQIEIVDADFAPIRESELRSFTKVCIGNSVFAQKLMILVSKDGKGSGKVSFDFETHKQFCTIKITD